MKKFSIIALLATSLFFFNCKNKENEAPVEVEKVSEGLSIVTDSTKVKWTAYKTTEKVAVGGTFQSIEIKDLKVGITPEAVLEGAVFNIPVSSLFTNNPDRDSKLKTLFFGNFKSPELLSGMLHFENNTCQMTLIMNEVTKIIPLTYTFENNVLLLNGELNVNDFAAQTALEALHQACFELHKGADGVSKTWETVAISGEVLFQNN